MKKQIPADEQWLHDNPKALKALKRAIKWAEKHKEELNTSWTLYDYLPSGSPVELLAGYKKKKVRTNKLIDKT